MGDHIFAYLMVVIVGLAGLYVLTYGIIGFLLYHEKVQAKANNKGKYIHRNADDISEKVRDGGSHLGNPYGTVHYKDSVFTYEKNGKAVMATAVNIFESDNQFINDKEIYTIKVSPFNPHKCYVPELQLYHGCSIPARIFIFVMRLLPRAGGLMLLGIAWFIYNTFINR